MEETMSTQASGIEELVRQLAARLTGKGWMLATAESCTGGMIAAACTDLAGSSQWFDRGFVTYSNEAKTEMLGVPAELIAKHGAVSEEVVRAMAEGAIRHSRAQVSIAVTGVAGPGGGSAEKPVGTVWVGWGIESRTFVTCLHLEHGRAAIRQATVIQALKSLLTAISSPS
jgi:nicotinamide-nucleotide amidase